MKKHRLTALPLICIALLFLFTALVYGQYPEESINLRFGKMGPVTFSHTVHVDRLSLECGICHHMDPDNPGKCTGCHAIKKVKNGVPEAREAFHQSCIGCHKEETQKSLKAPTKCLECHVKSK
jgi:hypothetical protein